MPTVLVVDDDQQIRGWLCHLLEGKGYQVEEAGDGKEALVWVERCQPELIVLDMYLPKMDGLEIIMHLQSHTLPVKIFAISGNMIDGFHTCQTALTLGAHDALSKPFSAEEFLQRVGALLSTT